ncbi:hypothetical protein Mycch_0665 [Mycolicibacterium chubuense NBB4]|uniref:Uncharacterized protein n=1 Tax=Mycolicibacterium chubuense (strain NBB4) TaxID=710421 RepID=I4BDX6_MYCCN|nr:hypothetical protein [Mycolicibacterium chubuense]AFM15483.1 hypothetical protein Mycch_0665 [Mycolicibacterium chubuense NBB4]
MTTTAVAPGANGPLTIVAREMQGVAVRAVLHVDVDARAVVR